MDSARRARHRSSASPVMRLYLIPASGLNSKVVTTGPGLICVTWPPTSNSAHFCFDGARAFLQFVFLHFLAAFGRPQQAGGGKLVTGLALGNFWIGAALARGFRFDWFREFNDGRLGRELRSPTFFVLFFLLVVIIHHNFAGFDSLRAAGGVRKSWFLPHVCACESLRALRASPGSAYRGDGACRLRPWACGAISR